MATPKTVKTYTLNGTLKDFPISFEYLARKFVVVTLIGATRKELVLNTDYRFTTPTQITTTLAWGLAQGYQLIEIRRLTSAEDRLVDFADGSILRAYDLNTSQVQSLHIAEEARDLTADTIAVNNDGNLDARGKRIVNVSDAIDPGDAVTLRQEQAWGASALNSALNSAASATASQASRLASEVARTAAQVAQAASEAARDLSATYRNASQTYSQNSQNSSVASEASNVLSQAWASKAEDVVVSGGLYSSYHYSRKSSLSATASANSATASGGSASASSASAAAAAASATALGNMTAFNENITTADTSYGVVMKRAVKATMHETGDFAGGAYVGEYARKAPFFSSVTKGAGSEYTPMLKVKATWTAGPNPGGSFVFSQGLLTNAGNTVAWATTYCDSVGASIAMTFDTAGLLTTPRLQVSNIADVANNLTCGTLQSRGVVWSGNGASWLNTDGNVYGANWGGYLSNFLTGTYVTPYNLMANLSIQATGGIVGAYTFGKNISGATQGLNIYFSGTSLVFADTAGNNFGPVTGVWRSMGATANGTCGLFIRSS
ncbi:MAG: phage tail fiber protein [Pseudomonas sp.]